ncbi:DUF3958 family protein [Listeria seeligeri]|uniref:DUF3958 family protein n=1 Tax=Listeria seeligeri TaxID=1640 RepID=UPI0016277532|nr:DUF3958 family protein [Listeria seeligeri]MBC1757438.1 DUF3958 family protein [Listeria seeligeri]MBC1814509.1 DUF3958 family protein [Listeria seeligeri]MBC2031091.1 DUF3958 family protein [Listeria seeligeri]MBC6115827.1 DUF3958 family protein [Listeria seeligeri]MBC6161673.1 DUF3958 family protein [Listeria seeligeri]
MTETEKKLAAIQQQLRLVNEQQETNEQDRRILERNEQNYHEFRFRQEALFKRLDQFWYRDREMNAFLDNHYQDLRHMDQRVIHDLEEQTDQLQKSKRQLADKEDECLHQRLALSREVQKWA